MFRRNPLTLSYFAALAAIAGAGALGANAASDAKLELIHCVVKSYSVERAPTARSSGSLRVILGCDEKILVGADDHEARIEAPYALASTFADLQARGDQREFGLTSIFGPLVTIDGIAVGPIDPLAEVYRQTSINTGFADAEGSALQKQISKILDRAGAPKTPRSACDSHHPEKPCVDVVDQKLELKLPNSKNVSSVSLLYAGPGFFHSVWTAGFVNVSLHAIADNPLGQDVTLSTEDAQAIREAFKFDDVTILKSTKGGSLRIELGANPRLVWRR